MKINILKTKFLCLITIAIAVSAVTAACSTSNQQVTYNMNPDLSSKVIGSESFQGFRIPAGNLSELLAPADLVVVGEVTSDAVTKTKRIVMNNADDAMAKKFDSLYPGKSPTFDVAQVKIKVDKVIFSKDALKEIEEITFSQLGNAKSNHYQTKVQKGKKLLFILVKNSDENAYSSVSFEDGLFYIDKNNKVLSMSKNLAVAKYDGLDLKILERDINNKKK